MERELICQNCLTKLDVFKWDEKNTLLYKPNELDYTTQSLDADTLLYTIHCPECSCVIQVII